MRPNVMLILILGLLFFCGCAAIRATNEGIAADPEGFALEKAEMEGVVSGFLPAWAQLVGLGGVAAFALAYGKRLGTNIFREWQAGKKVKPSL